VLGPFALACLLFALLLLLLLFSRGWPMDLERVGADGPSGIGGREVILKVDLVCQA
jgi:hypothetical protein